MVAIFSRYTCTYCGRMAGELDHVIPLKVTGERRNRMLDKTNTVPSCSSCNRHLWCFRVYTISDRAEFLARTFERTHRKFLSIPDWSEEELKEMSPEMCEYIESGLTTKKRLKKDLIHLLYVASLNITIAQVWKEIDIEEQNGNGRHG